MDESAILDPYSGGRGTFGDGTHHKKRKNGPGIAANAREGRTPIIKNIEVRDSSGKVYSPTWPKRAEGLVRHGRARWIGENAIKLTAPPQEETEDRNMTDNMENIVEDITRAAASDGRDYTTQDLLDTMVAILKQDDIAGQITEAIKSIGENMAKYQGPAEIIVDVEPLTELAEGFKENQYYALAIVERMYKGLHPEAYNVPKAPGPDFTGPGKKIRY